MLVQLQLFHDTYPELSPQVSQTCILYLVVLIQSPLCQKHRFVL